MFFLATADAEGRPQCSYKGGEPGFVRVVDEHTIAFPVYDGNGMYLSMGNMLVNPCRHALHRLRARHAAAAERRGHDRRRRPADARSTRRRSSSSACGRREVFANCPRYIHGTSWSSDRSSCRRASARPGPAWKRADWANDALAADNPASDPYARVIQRQGPPLMATYILLSTLSTQGVQTLKSNPDRLREVNKDVEELGAQVLHQWATLGEWDFVKVVEAPDLATPVARVSVALGARGSTQDRDAAGVDDRRAAPRRSSSPSVAS